MADQRRALPTVAADLAKLAEVSPSDVDDAKAAWDRDARAPFRGLLDAESQGGEEKIDRPILKP